MWNLASSNIINYLTSELLKPMVPSPTSSKYTATSIHFRDDGVSILICTLETHKVCVLYCYHILLH